jgi:acetylglutamate kinase
MTKKATSQEKLPRSRLRGFGLFLFISGLFFLVTSGFLYGFELVVSREIGLALVALSLGWISVGLGLISWGQGRDFTETMRAMGNLVFHEKIAILSNYLGKQPEQVAHDRQAALEFEKWVQPKLKEEFEDLWQEFFEKENKPIVVKIGGSTLGSQDTTLHDLITLHSRGFHLVVVHGGGNKVTEWLEKMGISTNFVRGLRVTDEETLRVVIAVLAGLVNKELVAAINSMGGKAIGLSGVDGALIQAKIEKPGIGYVGEVVKVNPESIITILSAGYIPVIAPGGLKLPDEDNDPVMLLNINGDVSASEIALALKADNLIFLTDVPGVQDSEGKVLPSLSPDEARALIDSGVITGGMIPKVEGCLRALSGVALTQIIDGRNEGALLAAIEGNGNGTIIE